MNRREFLKLFAAAPLVGMADWAKADAAGSAVVDGAAPSGASHPLVGKPLPSWKPGEFQVHFIYTGVAESMFWIMPDGTTMLLDCGDHPAWQRGKKAIWILPDGKRTPGDWIARYVMRVSPTGGDIDYLMFSHHHSDHTGKDGYGGILDAAKTLRFKTCFDRGWPNWNEPIPNERSDGDKVIPHLKRAIAMLCERDGMKMEKFEVGAVDQIAMHRNAAQYPFRITNICGNGKILCRDGSVRNLYADLTPDAPTVNENGMSLGLIAQYGAFRLYTAGDFSNRRKLADGSRMDIEAELAKELDPVDVAKVNHHGHHSMPLEIVAALRARVWTAGVWDTLHFTVDTMERLSSREAYAGPRLVAAPAIMPSRRLEDQGKAFMEDVAPEAFDVGHVVVTVAPGGGDYTVAYVTADDESMRVTGAYGFASMAAGGKQGPAHAI